ncbi:MAG TPA: hypothetical protein VH112_14355 [Acidimicrobiales bacterium]|nr:hypothetical protein [Acidimicrobiales bacterium]
MPTLEDTPPSGTALSSPRPRRGRRLALVALALAVVAGGVAFAVTRIGGPSAAPGCTATVASRSYPLELAQAANAATIAAVGKRNGVEDHGVTVALAAALQESRLHNLPNGDLDSVGLFQQRPSQGWGPASQLVVPSYAASAFYRALVQIPGWPSLPVTEAAQRVQRSAAPDAYAFWEPEARDLAQVLTGEVPSGLTCQFSTPTKTSGSSTLTDAMATELGSPALGATVTPARGWTVASWLVAYAYTYRVTAVSFAGMRWTPSSAKWASTPPVQQQVQLTQAGSAGAGSSSS